MKNVTNMASESCGICGKKFIYQVKRKRYDRVSIDSKVKRSGNTIKDVLERCGANFTPEKNPFVCPDCGTKVANVNKYYNSDVELRDVACSESYIGQKLIHTPGTPLQPWKTHKRQRIHVPSSIVKQFRSPSSGKKTSGDFKKLCKSYLSSSKYKELFRLLFSKSKIARNAMTKELGRIVQREIKTLTSAKTKSVWREATAGKGLQNLASFSWNEAHEEAQTMCPFLTAALQSSVATKSKTTEKIAQTVSLLFGQIVFAQKPRQMKVLQEIVGIQLWISGTAREVCSLKFNSISVISQLGSRRYPIPEIDLGSNP